MSERRAISLIVLSSLIWSTSFPAVKAGLSYIPPIAFVFLRFTLGTFFYILFFIIAKKRFKKEILKDRRVYALGIVTFLSYVFQYFGQLYTLASRTALIINLFVIWVPILAVLFLKEKFPKRFFFSIILLIPGMFLLASGKNPSEIWKAKLMIGDLIVLFASFCWAFYVIISKHLLEKYSTHELNVIVFAITALASFPLIFTTKTPIIINWTSTLLLLHLSLGCTVIAYYLYVSGLKHAGAIRSTIFVSLEVLFSFLIALIFLHEKWAPLELLGGALMLLAVSIAV